MGAVIDLKLFFTKLANGIANFILWVLNLRAFLPRRLQRIAEENLVCNTQKAVSPESLIRDQLTGRESGICGYRLGKADVRHTGCEIIAIYNALKLLGKGLSFAEVTHRAQEVNAVTRFPFVPWGAWGCNPFRLNRAARACGLQAFPLHSLDALQKPGVYILSFWNDGCVTARTGLHTVAAAAEADSDGILRCTTMNYDCRGGELRNLTVDEISAALKGGFIIGYRLET